jgi:hypothetical protein
LIINKIKTYGIPLGTLIIRGSQDHALVGPQPKGNIIKGFSVLYLGPFLFGVIAIEFKVLKESVSSKNGEGL